MNRLESFALVTIYAVLNEIPGPQEGKTVTGQMDYWLDMREARELILTLILALRAKNRDEVWRAKRELENWLAKRKAEDWRRR